MTKKLTQTLCKFSKVFAPFAFALAVLSANSTCWFFTHQPDMPEELNHYIK